MKSKRRCGGGVPRSTAVGATGSDASLLTRETSSDLANALLNIE
jgi:hypothetical protein